MGYPTYPFVSLLNALYTNLNTTPQVILEATNNTLSVTAINITNTGYTDIRINLEQERTSTSALTTISAFLVKDFLIPSAKNVTPGNYNSIELVARLGLNIALIYDSDIQERLICYSNGTRQKIQNFDCVINYTALNELPLT